MIQFKADKNNRRYIITTNLPSTNKKKIIALFIKYTEYARYVNVPKNFNLVLYNEAQESELFMKNEPSQYEIKTEPNYSLTNFVQFEVIKNYATNTHLGKTPIKNENFKIICFRRNVSTSIESLFTEISNETVEKIKKYEEVNAQDTSQIKELVQKWSHKNLMKMNDDLKNLELYKNREYLNEQNYKNLELLTGIINNTKKANLETLLKEPIFAFVFTRYKNIHDQIGNVNKAFGYYNTTPLMFASAVSPEMCEILLTLGADPSMKDSNGLDFNDYKKYAKELFEI